MITIGDLLGFTEEGSGSPADVDWWAVVRGIHEDGTTELAFPDSGNQVFAYAPGIIERAIEGGWIVVKEGGRMIRIEVDFTDGEGRVVTLDSMLGIEIAHEVVYFRSNRKLLLAAPLRNIRCWYPV